MLIWSPNKLTLIYSFFIFIGFAWNLLHIKSLTIAHIFYIATVCVYILMIFLEYIRYFWWPIFLKLSKSQRWQPSHSMTKNQAHLDSEKKLRSSNNNTTLTILFNLISMLSGKIHFHVNKLLLSKNKSFSRRWWPLLF